LIVAVREIVLECGQLKAVTEKRERQSKRATKPLIEKVSR